MAGQPYFNPMIGQSYMGGSPMMPAYSQMPAQMPVSATPMPSPTPYMIQVDGEMAARAWQMPNNLAPGTVIPIWDVDGVHVYFKSVDAYGRLNPTRKARVVFEESQSSLPEGQSGTAQSNALQNPDRYATKEDFEALKHEIRQMIGGNRQNGSRSAANGQQVRNGGESV